MKRMRRTIIPLLFTLLFLAGVTSGCDNDNAFKGENGKPTSIKYGDNSRVFFSYSYEGHINQIKEQNASGSIVDFQYQDNVLSSISLSPTDKRIADGHAFTKFTREGNKVIIEQTAEPDFSIYKQELELDNNDIPLQITDIGVYSHTGSNGEITKIREGESYAVFTYDPTTKNLLNQTVYNIATLEAMATYTYEYDNKPGVISKLDMPLWFYAFYSYRNKDYRYDNYRLIFFNYSNNVIKETVTNIAVGTEASTINYNHQYNNDNFPTSIDNGLSGGIYLSISY